MTPLRVDRDRGRRHEIAEAILAAFATDDGLEELRRRVDATPAGAPVAARLRAGLAAARARRHAPPVAKPLVRGFAESACLLQAGLFFEVHERLEPEWRVLAGPRRAAVQGVIQVVVALHHFAHGNVRGAGSLLAKGRDRLARYRDALPEIDVAAFLAALAAWESALTGRRWPEDLALPPLLVDVSSAPAPPPFE